MCYTCETPYIFGQGRGNVVSDILSSEVIITMYRLLKCTIPIYMYEK